MICVRCDHDVEPALVRHLEEGGPNQCPRCTLRLPEPSQEWLVSNGYNLYEETSDG